MSHLEISQGETEKHTIHVRENNQLTDADSTPSASVITPSSGSNAPSLGSVENPSTGIYKVPVEVKSNTTLSRDLDGREDWEIEWDVTVNTEDKTHKFVFVVNDGEGVVSERQEYATVNDVRRGILETRHTFTDETTDTIALPNREGREIIRLRVDGEEFKEVNSSPSAGEFTFNEPNRQITFGSSRSSSEIIEVKVGTHFTDEEVQEYLDEVVSDMKGDLASAYSLPFDNVPPELRRIARALTRRDIVVENEGHERFRPGEDQVDEFKERAARAEADLDAFVNGSEPLRDENGDTISRKSVTTEADVRISHEASATGRQGDHCDVLF